VPRGSRAFGSILIMSITKVSLLLIGGGLLWLGAEWHEDRTHARRHQVPAEAQLSTITGKAVAARVVDLKTKKGALADHYVELDIEGEAGIRRVRIGEPHPDSAVAGLGDEIVTAKFDPMDEDRVYSLSAGAREVITYRTSADYKTRLVASNGGGYAIGWIVVACGVLGLWLGRKPAT